jgi:FixJ family two-component response regulator
MTDTKEPAPGTVFIVDADDAARESAAQVLRAAGRDVETFDSAEEFLVLRGSAQCGCLVVEARLPGLSGLELQERLSPHRRTLPVLFVTDWVQPPVIVRAMKQGAHDFLQKPVDARQLVAAVGAAFASTIQASAPSPAVGVLTPREREVLDLILAGKQTRAIAASLFISIKTVEFHRSRIHAKLKVSSMAELFRLCLANAKPSQ